jgi:hypothetical protein
MERELAAEAAERARQRRIRRQITDKAKRRASVASVMPSETGGPRAAATSFASAAGGPTRNLRGSFLAGRRDRRVTECLAALCAVAPAR